MALFDIFKKKKERERFAKKQEQKIGTEKTDEIINKKTEALTKASGLVAPHITEKASLLKENNAYVFKIKPKANKIMIKQEIKKIYNVIPRKIRVINTPSKNIFVRGRHVAKPGFRKAVVYLKKGDKIEIS